MFKKLLISALVVLFLVPPAAAQMSYLDEMRALGTVAGQGMACKASLYDKYEMLARAIMLTKAPNQKILQDGIYAYNSAKADTYLAKQRDGGYLCGEIINLFNRQEIFQITLYEDGTLKMPDGKIVTPKNPYDAKQIYKRNDKMQNNLQEVYAGSVEKAQSKMQAAKVEPPAADFDPNRPLVLQAEPVDGRRVRQVPVAKDAPPSTIGHISRRSNR